MVSSRIIELQFKGYDNLTDEEKEEFDNLVKLENDGFMN